MYWNDTYMSNTDFFNSGLSSLFLTVFFYGAGPFLFYQIKRSTVTRKGLRLFCVLYASIVFILLRISGLTNSISVTPAFLWSIIFYKIISSKIDRNNAEPEQPNPNSEVEPAQNHQIVAATPVRSNAVQPSFYESEKAEEKQTYGPLDPPQHHSKPAPDYKPGVKFSGKIVWRVISVILICCLGVGTGYGIYRTGIAEEEARKWKSKYDSEKRAYEVLYKLYANLKGRPSADSRQTSSGIDFDASANSEPQQVSGFLTDDNVFHYSKSCHPFKNYHPISMQDAIDDGATLCENCKPGVLCVSDLAESVNVNTEGQFYHHLSCTKDSATGLTRWSVPLSEAIRSGYKVDSACEDAILDDLQSLSNRQKLGTVFYVTPYGEKYHRITCQHIVGSNYRVLPKDDAEREGYEPCSVCNP